MRIVCPRCQAVYDVPPAVIAAGRTLRCARCSADFAPQASAPHAAPVPSPPTPAVATTPVEPPLPTPPADDLFAPPPAWVQIDESQRRPAARRRSFDAALAAGWVVSLALVVAMGWSFLAWRAPIMRAWPASSRLYAAVGF